MIPRNDIRVRLTLTLAVVVLPMLVLCVMAVGVFTSDSLKQEADQRMAQQGALLLSSIKRWDEEIVRLLEQTVRAPAVTQMRIEEAQDALKLISDVHAEKSVLWAICDLNGYSIARSDRMPPIHYADRRYFKAALAGAPLTRDVVVNRTNGKSELVYSSPIRRGGVIQGVTFVSVKLTQMAESMQAAKFGKTGYAFVVDENGRVIVHPDPELQGQLMSLSEMPPVSRLIAGQTGNFHFTDTDGREWISHLLKMENGWGVVVLQEQRETLKHVAQLWWVLGFILFVVLAASTWVMWSRIGGLVRCIRDLADTATSFANGQMDTRAAVVGDDEISTLALAFNDMASRIADDIEKLEARVAERTETINAAYKLLEDSSAKLRFKENQIRNVLESSPLGISIVRRETGSRLWANSRMREMFGYSKDGDITNARNTWVNPDEYTRAIGVFTEQGLLKNFEQERLRVDGSRWWCMADWRPIEYEGQDAIAIWHYDITQRKTMEQALQVSEERLRNILALCPYGISITANDYSERMFVNQPFIDMLGASSEAEAMGIVARNRWGSEEDRQKFVAASAAKERISYFRTEVLRMDGSSTWRRQDSIPCSFEGRDAMINWHLDITEEIAREAELNRTIKGFEQANRTITALLEASGQGFLAFRQDLVVLQLYSQACPEILGQIPAGKPIDQLLFPDNPRDRELFLECVHEVFNEVDPDRKQLYLSLCPSTVILHGRHIRVELAPMGTRLLVTLTDYTEELALKEKLERDTRRMDLLTAVIVNPVELFAAIEEFRGFIGKGRGMPIQELYRAVHTFKGTFNQFGFWFVPKKLHILEEKIQCLLSEPEPTDVGDLLSHENWDALLAEDRKVLSIFGEDFAKRQGGVMMNSAFSQEVRAFAEQKLAQPSVVNGERCFYQKLATVHYVPIQKQLQQYNQTIQQTANKLGKKVAPLQVCGDDLEIDPEQFSGLLRALGHVFRNAVDHGIEDPFVRLEMGKNEFGTITCTVVSDEDTLVIQVADDGAGIDEPVLRARAFERMLDQARSMPLSELVFVDGLSSRDEATEISGRGVGMAAVKAAVDELDGRVSLETKLGVGTIFRFEFGLSTAIH